MPIKELYEIACIYLGLPDMARYIIGSFFDVSGWYKFTQDEDAYAEEIFKSATQKQKQQELKKLVLRYKGQEDASDRKFH